LVFRALHAPVHLFTLRLEPNGSLNKEEESLGTAVMKSSFFFCYLLSRPARQRGKVERPEIGSARKGVERFDEVKNYKFTVAAIFHVRTVSFVSRTIRNQPAFREKITVATTIKY